MKYFVMVGEGVDPIRVIDEQPRLPGGPWYTGQVLKYEVPDPLEYVLEVDEDYEDQSELNLLYLYGSKSCPVMHNSLLEALKAVGVDNLQVFPAHLKEPDTGVVHTDYWAFNVLGLISCADMERSKLMPHAKPSLLDTDFDSLAIDETKTYGQDLFRLAENCSAIMASERVRDEVEKRGIPGVLFYKPENWAG